MGVAMRTRVPVWVALSIPSLVVHAARVVKHAVPSTGSIQQPVDLYCSEPGGCGAFLSLKDARASVKRWIDDE